MKRNLLLITSILIGSLFSITSCSNANNKIDVYKIKDIDSFIYLSSDELVDLIKHEQSFILVVGEEGCSTCEVIKAPFINYIKKYNNIVYWIETNYYQKAVTTLQGSDYALDASILSSTVLIFKEGLKQTKIDYSSNIYYGENQLEYTLGKYISNKGIYSINDYTTFSYSSNVNMYKLNLEGTSKLDTLISSSSNVTILYAWKECSDCKEFKNSFLNSYIKNNSITLYEYEVNYYRANNEEGTNNFASFASTYQFDNYRNGRVPTLVTYNNSSKVDMAVYSNDEISQSDDIYKVTNSFYQSLIGLEDSDSLALHNSLIAQENQFIEEYLNKYAK